MTEKRPLALKNIVNHLLSSNKSHTNILSQIFNANLGDVILSYIDVSNMHIRN